MLKNRFFKALSCTTLLSFSSVHASFLYERASKEIEDINHSLHDLHRKIIDFSKDPEEENDQEEKAILAITGTGYLLVSQNKARQIASRDQRGRCVKRNKRGNHPVVAVGGVHFKSVFQSQSLNPPREFATYSFYKLLIGQGAPASTFLVLNAVKTPYDRIPYHRLERHRYVIQSSTTIRGEDFHDFFKGHGQNSLNFLDEESISGLILANLLTCPNDGKLDNFIVTTDLTSTGKRTLVSIDNDYNFFPSYLLERNGLKLQIRNVLYFEPFIKTHISSDLKLKIIKTKRELFILHWLATLWEQDKKYAHLVKEKFISEKEIIEHEFPLAIDLEVLEEIPKNLKKIQFWLKRKDVSLETLFRMLHPLAHAYYQKIFEEERKNVFLALRKLYNSPASLDMCLDLSEKLEDDRTIAHAINEEKARLLTPPRTIKKPLKKFAQEFFAHKFHLLYQMLQDKNYLTSFKFLLYIHYGKHFPVEDFSEFIFLQDPPIIERALREGGFLKVIYFLLSHHDAQKEGGNFDTLLPLLKHILQSQDAPDLDTCEINTFFDPPFDMLYIPRTDYGKIKKERARERNNPSLKEGGITLFKKETSLKLNRQEISQHKPYVSPHVSPQKIPEYISSLFQEKPFLRILDLSHTCISDREIDTLIHSLNQNPSLKSLSLTHNLIKVRGAFLLIEHFFASSKNYGENDRELDLRNNLIQIPDTQIDLKKFCRNFLLYNLRDRRGFLWLRGNPLSSSQLNSLDKMHVKKAVRAFIDTGQSSFLKKIDLTPKVRDFFKKSLKLETCDLSKSALRTLDMRALLAFLESDKNVHRLINLNIAGNALNKNSLMPLTMILGNQKNLVSLNFCENSFQGKEAKRIIEYFSSLSYLKKLNLASTSLSYERLKDLVSVLKNHPSLTFLNLANNHFKEAEADLLSHLLENHPHLDELDLRWNALSDQEARTLLNRIKTNTRLSILRLEENPVSASIIESISQKLSKNIIQRAKRMQDPHPEIEKLSYYKILQSAQEEMTSILKGAGSFYINGLKISPLTPWILSQTFKDHKIYSVTLRDCSLNDQELTFFAKKIKPGFPLKSLDLGVNKISNLKPLTHLLQKGIPLTHLDLSGNALDVAGVQAFLRSLESRHKIKELDLSCNFLPHSGVAEGIALIKSKTTLVPVQILNRYKWEEIIYFQDIPEVHLQEAFSGIFPPSSESRFFSPENMPYTEEAYQMLLKNLEEKVSDKILTPQQIRGWVGYTKKSRIKIDLIGQTWNKEERWKALLESAQSSYFKYLPVPLQYIITGYLDSSDVIQKFSSLSTYFRGMVNDYLKIKYPFFNKPQILKHFYRLDQLAPENKWLVQWETDILYNKEYYRDDILDKIEKGVGYFKRLSQKKEFLEEKFNETTLNDVFLKVKITLKDKFLFNHYPLFLQLTKAKLFFYISKIFPQEKETFLKKVEKNLHTLMNQKNLKSYAYGAAHFFKWKHLPEKNAQKQAHLLQEAADHKHSKAQFVLGGFYEAGKEGYPKDIHLALEWYTKAADQGHGAAQYILGVNYYEGQGVEKNKEKAVEWLKKAAAQGHAEAQEALKNME